MKERRAANTAALAKTLGELYARGTKGIRLGLDGMAAFESTPISNFAGLTVGEVRPAAQVPF